jgi:hypothetical protein
MSTGGRACTRRQMNRIAQTRHLRYIAFVMLLPVSNMAMCCPIIMGMRISMLRQTGS